MRGAAKAGAHDTHVSWGESSVAEKTKQVEMDRRSLGGRRDEDNDRRIADIEVKVERRKEERRKVPRRRQIDPTTCERDYTGHEIEFMQAMDAYKRASGRMFPTCSEILEVIRDLGYVRPSDDEAVTQDEMAIDEEDADSGDE
jgi:hypothetical protein